MSTLTYTEKLHKAKKLRAFWEVKPDELVGTVLHDMLAYHYSGFDSKTTESFTKKRKILGRLNDQIATTSSATTIH